LAFGGNAWSVRSVRRRAPRESVCRSSGGGTLPGRPARSRGVRRGRVKWALVSSSRAPICGGVFGGRVPCRAFHSGVSCRPRSRRSTMCSQLRSVRPTFCTPLGPRGPVRPIRTGWQSLMSSLTHGASSEDAGSAEGAHVRLRRAASRAASGSSEAASCSFFSRRQKMNKAVPITRVSRIEPYCMTLKALAE